MQIERERIREIWEVHKNNERVKKMKKKKRRRREIFLRTNVYTKHSIS